MEFEQAYKTFEADRELAKSDIDTDTYQEEEILEDNPFLLAGLTPCGVDEEGNDLFIGGKKEWSNLKF